MCRAVKCKVCGKTTWAGCGQHIASVRQGVPASQWCDGKHSADEVKAASASGGEQKSWLAGLFGR